MQENFQNSKFGLRRFKVLTFIKKSKRTMCERHVYIISRCGGHKIHSINCIKNLPAAIFNIPELHHNPQQSYLLNNATMSLIKDFLALIFKNIQLLPLTCRSRRSSPQITALFQSITSENGSSHPLLSNTGMQPACRASKKLELKKIIYKSQLKNENLG